MTANLDMVELLAKLADGGSVKAAEALDGLVARAVEQASGIGNGTAPGTIAGECAWTGEPQGSEPRCGKPTRIMGPKAGPREGQPRKFCPEHGKLARLRFRERMAASGSAERKVVNEAAVKAADAAARKVKAAGSPVTVTISPPTCSFALYVLRNVTDAERIDGEVTLLMGAEKAEAWRAALAGFDWTDATTTVPKVRVEA